MGRKRYHSSRRYRQGRYSAKPYNRNPSFFNKFEKGIKAGTVLLLILIVGGVFFNTANTTNEYGTDQTGNKTLIIGGIAFLSFVAYLILSRINPRKQRGKSSYGNRRASVYPRRPSPVKPSFIYRYEGFFKVLAILCFGLIAIGLFFTGLYHYYWRSPYRYRHWLALKQVPYDQSTFMAVIEKGNQPLVWNMLMAGINPNTPQEDGSTALMIATDRNYPEIAKTLLERGAETSTTNKTGMSALSIAINHGNLPIARYLRDYGATNNVGLWGAIKLGDSDFLRITIEQMRRQALIDLSPATGLVGKNDEDKINKGITDQINGRDKDGLTPLIWAILQDNGMMAAALMKEGADPNQSDLQFQQTPLYLAIERGNEGMVQILLANGAKLNHYDVNGRTPLIWAVIQRNPTIISAILAKQPDVNVKETQLGVTALSIAAMEGNANTVKWLLDAGADPLIKDNTGRNALDWAAMSDSPPVIETLINNRLSVFSKNPDLIKKARQLAELEKKQYAYNALKTFEIQ